MPFADANGLRLYWEEYGDPEAEPLLCVMGLGADHTSFYLQRRRWSERFRVILFDNRDVGQSSPVEGIYEVPDMAADTLALADALGLDSFHLLGVSMGGAISQEVALRARERVRTLTLCVTWAGSSMWGVERARTWAANAMRASWEEHIDQLLLLTLSERMYEDTDRLSQLRDLALGNPHPQPREAFARQLDAMGRHETRDRIGALAMPVHVIAAEHDVLVPPWKSDEIAALVPGSRLTVLEGAPHGVNLEQAHRFNEVVLAFLAEHAASPA